MRNKKQAIVLCQLAAFILLFVSVAPALASTETNQIVVPFQFYRHEVLIQVTINGQGPFPMLLDTGTNPSVIDLSLDVGIGSLSAPNIPALAMDLSELSRRFRRSVRGILGNSLLSGRVVQFDYPARVVRFLPRALPPENALPNGWAGHLTLPFHNEDCVQINGVTINGRHVRANIDTGSNSAFAITPRAIQDLGLTEQAHRTGLASGASFNGVFQSRVGTVDQITVGTIRVPHPKVTFWTPGTGHDNTTWGINIGNVFLQHYVVTFDYERKLITLDKPQNRGNRSHLHAPKTTTTAR